MDADAVVVGWCLQARQRCRAVLPHDATGAQEKLHLIMREWGGKVKLSILCECGATLLSIESDSPASRGAVGLILWVCVPRSECFDRRRLMRVLTSLFSSIRMIEVRLCLIGLVHSKTCGAYVYKIFVLHRVTRDNSNYSRSRMPHHRRHRRRRR